MNSPSDPVAALLEMAARVTQREPKHLLPSELWEFVRVLTAVAEQRPDWLAALPEADQQLFRDAMHAPLAAFESRDRVQ